MFVLDIVEYHQFIQHQLEIPASSPAPGAEAELQYHHVDHLYDNVVSSARATPELSPVGEVFAFLYFLIIFTNFYKTWVQVYCELTDFTPEIHLALFVLPGTGPELRRHLVPPASNFQPHEVTLSDAEVIRSIAV